METLCRLSYWGGARARGAVDGSQRYTAAAPFRQTVRRSPRRGMPLNPRPHVAALQCDREQVREGIGGGRERRHPERRESGRVLPVEARGLTIAEFIPRQVMHLQQLLAGFPLLAAADTV